MKPMQIFINLVPIYSNADRKAKKLFNLSEFLERRCKYYYKKVPFICTEKSSPQYKNNFGALPVVDSVYSRISYYSMICDDVEYWNGNNFIKMVITSF